LEGDVLILLEKLQRVADEIDRLDSKRRASTVERDRVRENLQEAEATLAEREERAHGIDIERRKRELALKSEKDKMQRVKSRMGDVKTSREYQAVLSEMGAAKQNISDQEESLQRDTKELEEASAAVEELKAKIRGIREDLDQAESALEAVLAEVTPAMEGRRGEETEILRSLPTEVVDRYRLIRSRRGGLAVVEARDEACTACFMRIPPQMYIEVIRRSKVIQCPNCHRILIPPRVAEEA
jgi:predicted  nucleic acid-binding Zn-ribbon protein